MPACRGSTDDGDSACPDVVPFPAVFEAGCLPLAGVGADGSTGVGSACVLYGVRGTLSGFCICICIDISSSSCFSAQKKTRLQWIDPSNVTDTTHSS